MSTEMSKPPMLDRYRVLDLADEKGSLCGRLLADFGADVIRVERPGGDASRNLGPFFHNSPDPEKSLFWFAYNANKRGITLNLETVDGQELFKRLAKTADFVIESFRPGYLEGLGLGYPALSQVNPRIIMTSVTPFGQTGPYSRYNASDLITMSMAGYVFICGDPDRPPVRFSMDQSYLQASSQAVAGTLIAHYYRELSGEGQHVDVSIQESMVWTLCYAPHDWFLNKSLEQTRQGSNWKRHDVLYHYIFPCKDGYVCYRLAMGAGAAGRGMAKLLEAMAAEGIGLEMQNVDWSSLSFDEVPQETINRFEDALVKYFAKYTKRELHEQAVKQENVLIPVNDSKDLCEDPQLAARDFWVQMNHPKLGTAITYPGPFFRSNETAWQMLRHAPYIGEHNEEVYIGELGLSKEDLSNLKRDNVI